MRVKYFCTCGDACRCCFFCFFFYILQFFSCCRLFECVFSPHKLFQIGLIYKYLMFLPSFPSLYRLTHHIIYSTSVCDSCFIQSAHKGVVAFVCVDTDAAGNACVSTAMGRKNCFWSSIFYSDTEGGGSSIYLGFFFFFIYFLGNPTRQRRCETDALKRRRRRFSVYRVCRHGFIF